MREIRKSGSEGGGAHPCALPTPISGWTSEPEEEEPPVSQRSAAGHDSGPLGALNREPKDCPYCRIMRQFP